MSNTVGVTVGKFKPFHKGHEFMIEFASRMVSTLYVIVSDKESSNKEMSLEVRYYWIQKFVDDKRLMNVRVVKHVDKAPTPINIDEHGTVLDKEFQYYWAYIIQKYAGGVTHFISSDRYGKAIANLMGIKWIPVDPDREAINISATEIRDNLYENFKYISDYVRPDFVKKVAIIGPESTGKSTLTKALAEQFGDYVPEYGRILSEAHGNDLSTTDFYSIFNGQNAMIDIMEQRARSPYLFVDTEAYTTYLFSGIYLKTMLDSIREEARKQNFDLYILLAPTVEWVDDGTRVMHDEEDRYSFFQNLWDMLKEDGKNFIIISDDNFTNRHLKAVNAVGKLEKGEL